MSAALPPRPPDPGRLRVGARLGTYEIIAPLGAGGMGEVFRAWDTKLGREARLRIAPLDPAGVIYGQLVTTADARYYLVRFRRMLSSLTLVEGLR